MTVIKKGEYLAPEVEVVEISPRDCVMLIGSPNEAILDSGNVYGDDAFI